jgi:hypothetical protein
VAFDCEERRHARLGDRQANAAQYGAFYCSGEEERADRFVGSYIVSFGSQICSWSYFWLLAPAIKIAFAFGNSQLLARISDSTYLQSIISNPLTLSQT